MMLLAPTLNQFAVRFVTTEPDLPRQRGIANAGILPDCNQNQPLRSLWCAGAALIEVLRHRPHVVISTGAAPGFFCILAGRLTGARTMWIDSVANGEELSMCGKLSKRFAHQCLTQWEHLASDPAPRYFGAVL
jgi:UDP-N-acetylglucosamine:LPS N-acetylglucosamine transferase